MLINITYNAPSVSSEPSLGSWVEQASVYGPSMWVLEGGMEVVNLDAGKHPL